MSRLRILDAILGLGLCLSEGCAPPPTPKAAPSAPAAGAEHEVSLAVAEDVVWERVLRLTGELVPAEESTISTKVGGRLESLDVDVGTRVHPGACIARIEAKDFELRERQAAASLQAARAVLGLDENAKAGDIDPEKTAIVREARAELDQARRDLERATTLVASGAATQSTKDTAETAVSAAESRWQAAKETVATRRATVTQREAELEIARQQSLDTKITAPYEGVVSERLAGLGDYLIIGSPLAHLLRTDPVRLRAIVSEQSSGLAREGQALRLNFDSGAAAIVAHVSRMSPALGARDRTLMLEADIANPEGLLRPGSFVRADLVLDPAARTLAIPPSALVRFAGIDKVFLDEADLAVERRVKVGRTEEKRVEILSGLQSGDRVVIEPGKLQGGTRLRVRAKD
jgi:multidrug efflux pump subunit AcrA (membrane-fusion protein)